MYRPETEGAGRAMDYVRDFTMRYRDKKIELLSLDSTEGDNLTQLYGITNYPAILALSNEGQLLQLWQDDQLPLMNELDAYLQ